MKLSRSGAFFLFLFTLISLPHGISADTFSIVDEKGKAITSAMITEMAAAPEKDTSDNGYQTPGIARNVPSEVTLFSDTSGRASFPRRSLPLKYRVRKPGFRDALVEKAGRVTLIRESDPAALAASRPANAWLGSLNLTPYERTHFHMQCGFCHQQGSAFTRKDRSPEEWSDTIKRMIRYGSRLPTTLQKSLPEKLNTEYRRLREHPEQVRQSTQWMTGLSHFRITEWPIGDAMSQTHDMLIGKNGFVYVADNIQDRIYEIQPLSDTVTVYRIPHREDDSPGGLIAGRMRDFPKHDSTSNAHSLALSETDGHIFITPSAQRRLIEFDPVSKTFTMHEMDQGFYPHTIRIDAKDRVWFTLALSNQVAMFDRHTKAFTYFYLPPRSFRERITIAIIPFLFRLMKWGLPVSNWLAIDDAASGTPLPYGIEAAPDGMIYFSRLHTQEIGRIDPEKGSVTMIPVPFAGPRRLRADAEGNIWITSFGESKIAMYSPSTGRFSMHELPVSPAGSDTPYALNVDRKRRIVWVNGNQSDSIYAFDIAKQSWSVIPLPRRTTFTRDFDIDAKGAVYTSNSNFPAWHVEGAQPTLIRIERR